jgi:quercetin dioxygenase-like cupin family protein
MNRNIKQVGRAAAAACALATMTFIAGAALAQPPGETGRVPQFENDQVKVWKSVVQPHSPLPLHRHEHPRVIIALVGGVMQIVQQDGPTETHDWRSGNAYWLPSNAPGAMHIDVNAGDKPIEVMVVELKTAK